MIYYKLVNSYIIFKAKDYNYLYIKKNQKHNKKFNII